MADSNNNSNQQEESSTISYLPILFANGYPTSLERMTAEQLELFIPFLVKCSLNLKMEDEPKEAPKWWPNNLLEYRNPFEKPKFFRKSWIDVMKMVVQKCYDFHKQPFLLKYSKDLSENDTANLRYVKDSNSTTALWSRNPAKLLLTFRNELMLYDKKKRRQLWKKDESQQESSDEISFDIFLCDYCDATFVSEEAYTEHEKKCNNSTEQEAVENIVISDDDEDDEDNELDDEKMIKDQTDFMSYFFLASANATELPRRNFNQIERSLSPKKKKRQTRARKIISQKEREKEFSIPFSSPAGVILSKKSLNEHHILENLNDIESYCTAKPNSKLPTKNKFRYQQSSNTDLKKAMRRTRPYYWPKRHLHSKSREKNFEFLNRWLIEDCQPLSIVAAKMTPDSIRAYRERLARLKLNRERKNCVDLISDSDEEETEIEVKDSEFHEAMTKLNGHFLTMPINSSSSPPPSSSTSSFVAALTKNLPKYSDVPSFPHSTSFLSNNEIRISRRSTIVQQQHSQRSSLSIFSHTTTTTSAAASDLRFKRSNDVEINHTDSKRTKTIHEWLNNVNGESFNQISHLINS